MVNTFENGGTRFSKLRLRVQSHGELPSDHPFELIKLKVYIPSTQAVRDEAITASMPIVRQNTIV